MHVVHSEAMKIEASGCFQCFVREKHNILNLL